MEGRDIAAWLSACLEVSLAEWRAAFREHAQLLPAEADAIVAALVEFLRRPVEAP